MTIPPSISHSVQLTQEWLKSLRQAGDYADEAEALAVLRAVLHQLRDRLTPDEAVALGAQLPVVVRGFYYEGWRPSKMSETRLSKRQFLEGLATKLAPHPIAAETAAQCVFSLLALAIDRGEVAKVMGHLPATLKELWPGHARDWYVRCAASGALPFAPPKTR
jgi:uncharacterized protein (DUF2267 family)